MTQDVGQLLGFLTLEGVDAKLLTQLSTFGVPLKSLHHTIAYHPCLSQCFFLYVESHSIAQLFLVGWSGLVVPYSHPKKS